MECYIVTLEGGCCSGKSTIGREMKKDGWIYFPEAMSFLTPEEKKLLWSSSGTDLAIELLLESERRRFLEIKKLPDNSKIILDRSYHTFLAFEYGTKNIERFEKFYFLFKSIKDIPKPELVIFINLDYQERLKRLTLRGDVITDKTSIIFQEEFNERMKKYFSLYCRDNKKLLDSSKKNKEETFSEIKEILNSLLKNKTLGIQSREKRI